MLKWLVKFSVGLTVCCGLIMGCSHGGKEDIGTTEGPPTNIGPTGTMQLALVSSGSSGAVYRLRDAVFRVTSVSTGDSFEVSTEADPDRESIDLDLAVDLYAVFLQPGFRLERISDGNGGPIGDTDGPIMDTEGPIIVSDVPATLKELKAFLATHANMKVGDRNRQMAALSAPEAEVDADGGVGEPDGGPVDVDAELISENPLLVPVTANSVSEATFVFQLGGVVIGDNGTLSIGIEVIDDMVDCTDAYEPNDDEDSAAPVVIGPGVPGFTAMACMDDDFYVFDAPVPEGEPFAIDVLFSNASSDIDVFLIDSSFNVVAIGGSVSDNEQVGGISNGEPYMLYIFTYSFNEPTPYEVVYSDATMSDCCQTSPFPGCTDEVVESCVCDMDPWCCEVNFDQLCAMEALQDCGGTCPLGDNDCCDTSEEPGCNDPAVHDCVCGADIYCCIVEYDDWCVELAGAACGLECGTSDPDSNCCEPGQNPGCTDETVEDCVCGIDPTCCALPFDSNCVNLAVGVCGATC